MFKHILVPTDGSKLSDACAQQAIEMAKALAATITALHVRDQYQLAWSSEGDWITRVIPALQERFDVAATARAKKILDSVKAAANKAGVECDTVVASGTIPYEAIIKQAKKANCDLIMMASHGRTGIQSILLGSETVKVLTHSKIPVLVVR